MMLIDDDELHAIEVVKQGMMALNYLEAWADPGPAFDVPYWQALMFGWWMEAAAALYV